MTEKLLRASIGRLLLIAVLLVMVIGLVTPALLLHADLIKFVKPVGGTVTVRQVDSIPCGDVTGDGRTDVLDAVTVLQFITGQRTPTGAQLALGDIDRDGTINILDAIGILQIVVGRTVVCNLIELE